MEQDLRPPEELLVESDRDSLGAAVKDLTDNISTLIRKEVELAREETMGIVRQKLAGLGFGAIALTVTLLLLPFLLLTLIEVLAIWMPRWAASLTTSGVLVLVGVIAVLLARRYLKGAFLPQDSIESIKEDARWAKHLKR